MNDCLFVKMQVANRIGIYRRLFCRGNLVSKNFKKLFLVLSIFTGLYHLQPRNSTKPCCSRWFHEIALKYLHQTPWSTFRKTVRSGVSYYQTKNSNADTGTCLENFENYEPLQNCSFSINLAGLQIKVSDFNKNGLREKIFL